MMVGICLWYVFWLCYPVRTPPRAAVAQPRNRQAVGSTAASNNVNVEAQVVPEVSLNIKSFEEGSIKGEERDKECAICIAGFEKGDISTILSSCNHKFHSDCIAIWLRDRHTSLAPFSNPSKVLNKSQPAFCVFSKRTAVGKNRSCYCEQKMADHSTPMVALKAVTRLILELEQSSSPDQYDGIQQNQHMIGC
nr:RING-H2 finger protein ATL63 [Ipomoea trifida]